MAEAESDIVSILGEARRGDPRVEVYHMRAAICARKLFDLNMRQTHYVAGWLAGEVSDVRLRIEVPLN